MISVIIATYNGEKYIEKQLLSIINQSVKPDEVIIRDDCSKDDTIKICNFIKTKNSDIKIHIIKNKTNLGFSKNFMNAIYSAKGDYIFLCDQDDLWYKDKIKDLVSIMKANDYKLVSCNYDIINEDDTIINNPGINFYCNKDDCTIDNITFNDILISSCIRGCSICLKKEILVDGNYVPNLNLNLGHDWYLVFLALCSGKVARYNKKLFGYRVHGTNLSLKSLKKKTTLSSTNDSRIEGFRQVVDILEHLRKQRFVRKALSHREIKLIDKNIHFFKNRILFTKNKSFLAFLWLLFHFNLYIRIVQNINKGFKLLISDCGYAFNLQLQIRR